MSWTEINSQGGMPFGGMPHDEILYKLEETDPELVADVRGNDPFDDLEDAAHNYIRSEIVDWSPDPTFLESDHHKRDPAQSRSVLNLRLNGTRGSNYELPQHPELFIGFTGNDPRGVDNQPRFDQIRSQIEARAANLQARMGVNIGHSDDGQIAERPWTEQSISYGRKEIHRRLRDRHLKVFSVQKEGRPFGRNVAADDTHFGPMRGAQLEGGTDGLFIPEQDGGGVGASHPHYVHGYEPAQEAMTERPRRVDSAFRDGAEIAPWRHTIGDSDLAVQRYGMTRAGAAPALMAGDQATGGANVAKTSAEQDYGASYHGQSSNRSVLGASMAQAAQHRHANRSAQHDSDHGSSHVNPELGKTDPTLRADIAMVYRDISEDSDRRPQGTVQDDEGGVLGTAAGLTPAERSSVALESQPTHTPPPASILQNMAPVIAAGLREGSAASKRQIQNMVQAGGVIGTVVEGLMGSVAGGLRPASDATAISRMSDMPTQVAAAAQGLEVQTYGGYSAARAAQQLPRVAYGQTGVDSTGLLQPGTGQQRTDFGKSGQPMWRSHTQDQGTIGGTPAETFGWDGSVEAGAGHAPVGIPTGVRPDYRSDDVMVDGGFSGELAAMA